MKKLISILLSLAMLTGVLAGCTSSPSQNQESSEAVSSSTSKAQPDDKTKGTWPRTITDATGKKIVLEKKPERVSLLHIVYLEHFLALGAPPTAAALGNAQGDVEALESSELLWPHLKDTNIMMLGNALSLSPEAVLASKPDVIVTFYNPAGLDQYEQLVQIAPVIQISYTDTWQNQLRLCAQIIGLEKEAEDIIKNTETTIAETKKNSGSLCRPHLCSFSYRRQKLYFTGHGSVL